MGAYQGRVDCPPGVRRWRVSCLLADRCVDVDVLRPGISTYRYWLRAPTGEEWVVQTMLGINQGALGVVPWADPTPADIKSAASAFALSLPMITPHLFDPKVVRWTYTIGGASIATWNSSRSHQTLVLATNTYYVDQTVSWEALGLEGTNVTTVFVSGAVETASSGFTLGPVGSGIFLVAG